MKLLKRFLVILAVLLAILASFVAGAVLQSRGMNPLSPLKKLLGQKYDAYERLADFPGKSRIPCPIVNGRTEVLLLMGQSNSANFAEQRHTSKHGQQIVNFFDGHCFVASSPLLGSSATRGESWTLLANKMISSGMADTVVLIPTAIGSTAIDEWAPGGRLHPMILGVLDQMTQQGYTPTRVIWHQGESDFKKGTAPSSYKEKFESLVASLRGKGVVGPIYPAVATAMKDHPNWKPNNSLAAAQSSLKNVEGVVQVIDTDLMVSFDERYDGSHFGSAGQEKYTDALISAFKSTQSASNAR